MIRLQVLGNVGKDPTVNNVNNRVAINFNVAVTEKWKDAAGNQQEKTRWIDCALWRETGNIAQYIKKGDKIYVEGVPDATTYQKQDGTTVAIQKLRVTNIVLLGGGNKQQGTSVATTSFDTNSIGDPGDEMLSF